MFLLQSLVKLPWPAPCGLRPVVSEANAPDPWNGVTEPEPGADPRGQQPVLHQAEPQRLQPLADGGESVVAHVLFVVGDGRSQGCRP